MSAVAGPVPPTASPTVTRKASTSTETKEKEKRYKCQFCNRAFSRSEHRSRHERSRKLYLSFSLSSLLLAGVEQSCLRDDRHHEVG